MNETKKNINPSRWKCEFTLKKKDHWLVLQQQAMSQLDGKKCVRCK